jgi:hypothetical protein
MLKRGHIKEKVDELIRLGDERSQHNGKELTWIAHSRFLVTVGKGEKN